MATYTQTITDTAHDRYGNGNGIFSDRDYLFLYDSGDYRAVLGFDAFPAAASITSATLTVYTYAYQGSDPSVQVWGIPGASTPVVQGSDIQPVPTRTSASTVVTAWPAAGATKVDIDVTSVVAEMASASDVLKFYLQSGFRQTDPAIYDASDSSSRAASLSIDYVPQAPNEGTASVNLSLAASAMGDAPVVPPAEGAASVGLSLAVGGYGSGIPSGAGSVAFSLDPSGTGGVQYSGDGTVFLALDPSGAGRADHDGTTSLGLSLTISATGGQPVPEPPPPWREAIRSQEYLDAISARTITVDARVEIIDQTGTILATLGGDDADYAGIVSGEVTCDATREVRWDCSLQVDNAALTPKTADSLLHPLAHNRIRVWWRILVGPSDWIEIPVGTYYPDMPSITDTGEATVSMSIKGKDAAAQIGMVHMLASLPVGGQRVHDAVRRIIGASAPWASMSLEDTDYRLPADYEAGEPGANPWTVCLELARSAGQALFVDREGVVRTETEAALSDQPKASFVEGPGCQAVEATATIPLDDIANRVTVEATASEDENGNELDPFYVTVEDTSQDSPLWTGHGYYYDKRVETDAVVSKDQARAYGMRVMEESQRLVEDSEILSFPRPDLSPADVVAVALPRVGMLGHRRLLSWSLALGDLGGQRNVLTGRRSIK